MKTRVVRTRHVAVPGMIFASCASVALAQEEAPAAPDALQEIIVTAERRPENLQTTPISLTALTGATLESRGVVDVSGVGDLVPNMTTTAGTSGSGGNSNLQLYIRGVGQFDFLAATDPGVGVYVDGVYYSRAMGGIFDLLDVERIEVLRGPQGTLFGKNALGGAVQVVTAKPTGELAGTLEATYGRFNRVDVRGSLNMPIYEDRAALRVSFSSKTADPYGKRLDFTTGRDLGNDMGDQDDLTARATLLLKPADRLEVLVSYDRTREREQSAPVALAGTDQTQAPVVLWNALVGGPAGTPFDNRYVTSGANAFTSYATAPSPSDLDVAGGSATITWRGDALEAKSITAYRSLDAVFGVDQDASPLNYSSTYDTDAQHQFSQELQFSGAVLQDRLQWLVGGFYFNERTSDANNVRLLTGLYPALQALPGPLDGSPLSNPTAPGGFGNPLNLSLDLNFNLDSVFRTRSYAAFSQETFALTDRLSLTAGIRYTQECKTSTVSEFRTQSLTYVIDPGTEVGASYSATTPKGSIDYRFTDDLYGYLSYSEGFKSGGFNGRPTAPQELTSFNPEHLKSYELGTKATLWDRRIRLNADIYYANYTDIQLRTNSLQNGLLVVSVGNAGAARIEGFETELTLVPVSGLQFRESVGFTDFKYTALGDVPGLTLESQPIKTPRWTNSLSAQYSLPTGVGSLTFLGDWIFRTKSYADAVNTPILATPTYSLFNARTTLEFPGDHWSLAAYVNNIADKRVVSDGFTVEGLGFYDVSYLPPREWGLTAQFRF
jgi:iron complex outermembrane recepter protein